MIEWENPNKMHFESAHKTFNRQCRLIRPGNTIGDVQLSFYIRPYHETECNGLKFKEGELQNYDLEWFSVGDAELGARLEPCMDEIRRLTKENGGILYLFKHYTKGKRMLDGLVLTSQKRELIKRWYLNQNWKARDAVDKAIEYIVA